MSSPGQRRMPRAEGKDDDVDETKQEGKDEDEEARVSSLVLEFCEYGVSDRMTAVKQEFFERHCAGFEEAEELERSGRGHPYVFNLCFRRKFLAGWLAPECAVWRANKTRVAAEAGNN